MYINILSSEVFTNHHGFLIIALSGKDETGKDAKSTGAGAGEDKGAGKVAGAGMVAGAGAAGKAAFDSLSKSGDAKSGEAAGKLDAAKDKARDIAADLKAKAGDGQEGQIEMKLDSSQLKLASGDFKGKPDSKVEEIAKDLKGKTAGGQAVDVTVGLSDSSQLKSIPGQAGQDLKSATGKADQAADSTLEGIKKDLKSKATDAGDKLDTMAGDIKAEVTDALKSRPGETGSAGDRADGERAKDEAARDQKDGVGGKDARGQDEKERKAGDQKDSKDESTRQDQKSGKDQGKGVDSKMAGTDRDGVMAEVQDIAQSLKSDTADSGNRPGVQEKGGAGGATTGRVEELGPDRAAIHLEVKGSLKSAPGFADDEVSNKVRDIGSDLKDRSSDQGKGSADSPDGATVKIQTEGGLHATPFGGDEDVTKKVKEIGSDLKDQTKDQSKGSIDSPDGAAIKLEVEGSLGAAPAGDDGSDLKGRPAQSGSADKPDGSVSSHTAGGLGTVVPDSDSADEVTKKVQEIRGDLKDRTGDSTGVPEAAVRQESQGSLGTAPGSEIPSTVKEIGADLKDRTSNQSQQGQNGKGKEDNGFVLVSPPRSPTSDVSEQERLAKAVTLPVTIAMSGMERSPSPPASPTEEQKQEVEEKRKQVEDVMAVVCTSQEYNLVNVEQYP